MTYSSCLHDQQDLCWGNTSRDTSEESQESQEREVRVNLLKKENGKTLGGGMVAGNEFLKKFEK